MLVAGVKNVNGHRNLTDCIFTFCHFLFDMPGTDLDDVPRAAGSGRMVKCLYRRVSHRRPFAPKPFGSCPQALSNVLRRAFVRVPKGFGTIPLHSTFQTGSRGVYREVIYLYK